MTKDQILMFAMNRKPSNKGLVYSYEIDECDKVKIVPIGMIDEADIDENICIVYYPIEHRVPIQSEIDEALNDFVNSNGRDSFRLTK